MNFRARLCVFVWWCILEIIAVPAVAFSSPGWHGHDLGEWVMGFIIGTLYASLFCGLSTAFVGWTFFGWKP